MRIALLNSCYWPDVGGAELFAHEIAARLVRDGHQVDVFAQKQDENRPGFEVFEGVPVHRMARRATGTRSVFPLWMVWQVTAHHHRLPYDIIHSVGETMPGLAGALSKELTHRPFLVTIQGGILQRGFTSHWRDGLARRWVGGCLRRANRVHAISRTLAAAAEDLGASQVVVIPNGVDEALFRPFDKVKLRAEHGILPRQKVVVTVCRLIPRKGVKYALQAAALVARDIPDLRMIVIGEGPQRTELERLISELQIEDRVDLKGWVQHDRLPEYLSLADVFVSTPDFEGLGIVFIEALACGVPTIGSNVGGIPDIIQDGHNGVLVAPGDVPALARALTRVLGDEALCHRFGQEGQNTVRARFRWESVYQQVTALYTELLDGRNDKP